MRGLKLNKENSDMVKLFKKKRWWGKKGKYEIIGANMQIIEKLNYKYPI